MSSANSPIKIAGWKKVSLIDYPGKVASVIFLAGCNMCCHYCHNHHILDSRKNQVSFNVVLRELRRCRDWVNAVVVSGGEPSLYPNLIPLLQSLKSLGLLVKLDTNGTRPAVVKKIVNLGLVDYIALDIKAPPLKHVEITGLPIDAVLETANFLKRQKQIPYQFRTTLSPFLCLNDLIIMAEKIIGSVSWQIQQCRCSHAYSPEEIKKMVSVLKRYNPHIVVKGL